ncbi:hypothetical protein PVAND_008131 [Polypedilum vanderplanki]|uniref:Uncharacterized protein n=1 Tax=Polypedilum vanderplanki TaxID=319348 RepID=A0A9J6C9L6_POLVA|nr:hypothetical protein PVAND_008131 [Polypedilum vanderplanki]
MRTLAAIIVIILISSLNINANEKHEINDLESLKSSFQNKDQKVQKDLGYGDSSCPACDSSVYSYCDQKIFHDACCCGLAGLQPQCQYSDCSYIYANSCQEHQLITNCCCYNPYRNS